MQDPKKSNDLLILGVLVAGIVAVVLAAYVPTLSKDSLVRLAYWSSVTAFGVVGALAAKPDVVKFFKGKRPEPKDLDRILVDDTQ
ncbi:MAG: hypothetical protein KatS3mg082_1390 [Nitrospiraceae bacterium]|nr:MAG: hypothetical protein KatS3mg082_1390 [Nitrospiraceae bacterium]